MTGWPARADRVMRSVQRTFGVPATYTPGPGRTGEGIGTALSVVFDEAAEQIMVNDGGEVSTAGPQALLREADLPDGVKPYQHDRLSCDGREWNVVDTQADGQGGCILLLRLAHVAA